MSKWKVERLTDVWTDEKKTSCICSAYSSIYAEQIVKEHNAINSLIESGVITVKLDESEIERLKEMPEKLSVYRPVTLEPNDYEELKRATIDLIDSLDIGAMTYPGVAEAVQKAKDAMK